MKTRIISGLVMAPFLILVIIGGPLISILCLFIALMGMREFFNGFKAMEIHACYPAAVISVLLLYGVHCLQGWKMLEEDQTVPLYMAWLFVSVLMCLLYLFKIEERRLEDALVTITGIVYIGFFSYHAVLTEFSYSELCKASPVWLILITAFCTDIFAYFGGFFLGRHKLCPVISPKKTVEGSVCGILGSLIFSMLFGWFFMDRSLLWACGVIGILGGITSQFGDLTASIFKRKMDLRIMAISYRDTAGSWTGSTAFSSPRLPSITAFSSFRNSRNRNLRMQNDLQTRNTDSGGNPLPMKIEIESAKVKRLVRIRRRKSVPHGNRNVMRQI